MISAILDWLGWEKLSETKQRHKEIIMKLSEILDKAKDIDSKLTEASGEIVALIKKLQDQLSDVDVPDEAAATLESIATKAAALADIVPNP